MGGRPLTAIRFYLDGNRAGPLFQRALGRHADEVRAAARGAAQDAAEAIEDEGRIDIRGAGNFGSRWTEGLHARVTEGGGNIRINVSHDVPYWVVFEEGRVIQGNPLLWIPLSFAGVPKGMWARDYPEPLFRVDRLGGKAPLLLAPGKPAQPKYFGKEQVKIPKKFHLREIVRATAKHMVEFYKTRMQGG